MLLEAILHAHPHVHGRVLDLAPTAAAATARFAAAGLQNRASAITGSFFEPLPAGADAYLLSDILHDWDDEHAPTILTHCRRAAAPHSTVVLIEPARGHGADTGINLFMLMCFGSTERTVDQLTELAGSCGLALHSSAAVTTGRMALEHPRPHPHELTTPGSTALRTASCPPVEVTKIAGCPASTPPQPRTRAK